MHFGDKNWRPYRSLKKKPTSFFKNNFFWKWKIFFSNFYSNFWDGVIKFGTVILEVRGPCRWILVDQMQYPDTKLILKFIFFIKISAIWSFLDLLVSKCQKVTKFLQNIKILFFFSRKSWVSKMQLYVFHIFVFLK